MEKINFDIIEEFFARNGCAVLSHSSEKSSDNKVEKLLSWFAAQRCDDPKLLKALEKVLTNYFGKKEDVTIYTLKINNRKLFKKILTPNSPESFAARREMKLSIAYAKQMDTERFGSVDKDDYDWKFDDFCKGICEAEITLTQNEIIPGPIGEYRKNWVEELAKKWPTYVAEQAHLETK